MARDLNTAIAESIKMREYRERVEFLTAAGVMFDAYYHYGKRARIRIPAQPVPPKPKRPKCGAITRTGAPCCAPVAVKPDRTLSKRCRLHGGLATGPRTMEGRQAIADANRTRKGVPYGPRLKREEPSKT